MLNRVVLIGRLTADPQLRYAQTGSAVANFTLAVERTFKNQSGEKEVDFINIVAWNKLAEVCANNLDKGRLVAVEGRLQIRSYEYEGQKRKAADIIADNVRFLDYRKDNSKQSDQEDYDGPDEFAPPF
jgi:single-strand DNA-binding protein